MKFEEDRQLEIPDDFDANKTTLNPSKCITGHFQPKPGVEYRYSEPEQVESSV